MTTTNDARERLWALVHARLDARLDPLADEAVAELLLDDPEALAEVLELTARLRRLDAAREPAPARRAPRWVLAAAAGLLLLALGALALRGAVDEGGGSAPSIVVDDARPPAPDLDRTAVVHHLQITVTTERLDPDRGAERIVTHFDGERAERTVERRLDAPSAPDAGGMAPVLATIRTTRSLGGTQP